MTQRIGFVFFKVTVVFLGVGHAILPVAKADCTTLFFDDLLYDVGELPRSVAIGDLDGDGDADLAVVNEYGFNVSILLNNGDGSFADDVLYHAGRKPNFVAIGDLDGDGDADLALTKLKDQQVPDETVAVLLNNGVQSALATGRMA